MVVIVAIYRRVVTANGGRVGSTYYHSVLNKLFVCKKVFFFLFIIKFVFWTSSRYNVRLNSGMKRFDLIQALLGYVDTVVDV